MSVSRRTNLADLLKQAPSAAEPSAEQTPDMRQPIVSGALRAMGLQLEQMSSEANEARELKSKIAAGDHVVSLDPGLFDPSFLAMASRWKTIPSSTPSLQASPSVDNKFQSLPVRIHRRRTVIKSLMATGA